MTYVAIPYSFNPDLSYRIVTEICTELLNQGEVIYSPINMFHHLSVLVEANQKDSYFWLRQCLPVIPICKKVLVIVPMRNEIGVSGERLVRDSIGVQAEITEAKKHGILVEYYPY